MSTSDVDLAVASKAIIFGFNVKAPGSVKSYADNKGVEIRLYRVIYELIDDVRNAMEGLLEPVEVSGGSILSFFVQYINVEYSLVYLHRHTHSTSVQPSLLDMDNIGWRVSIGLEVLN